MELSKESVSGRIEHFIPGLEFIYYSATVNTTAQSNQKECESALQAN